MSPQTPPPAGAADTPVPERLTPHDVREAQFGRNPIGRRGYHEDEVDEFLGRVEQEMERLARERDAAVDEARRLRNWVAALQNSDPSPSRDAQPTLQAVEMLSSAQQQADALIADATQRARDAGVQARSLYESIIGEAHARAAQILQEAAATAELRRGDLPAAGGEVLDTARRALLMHLRTMESFCRVQMQELQVMPVRTATDADPEATVDTGSAARTSGRTGTDTDTVTAPLPPPPPYQHAGQPTPVPAPPRPGGPGSSGIQSTDRHAPLGG